MRRDGVARQLLELGIDRRVDLEAAEPDRVGPVLLDQLLLYVVEEVLLSDLVVARAALEAEAAADHLLVLGSIDVALLLHRVQHQVAALGGPLGVDERVVLRGRLRQPASSAASLTDRSETCLLK